MKIKKNSPDLLDQEPCPHAGATDWQQREREKGRMWGDVWLSLCFVKQNHKHYSSERERSTVT